MDSDNHTHAKGISGLQKLVDDPGTYECLQDARTDPLEQKIDTSLRSSYRPRELPGRVDATEQEFVVAAIEANRAGRYIQSRKYGTWHLLAYAATAVLIAGYLMGFKFTDIIVLPVKFILMIYSQLF